MGVRLVCLNGPAGCIRGAIVERWSIKYRYCACCLSHLKGRCGGVIAFSPPAQNCCNVTKLHTSKLAIRRYTEAKARARGHLQSLLYPNTAPIAPLGRPQSPGQMLSPQLHTSATPVHLRRTTRTLLRPLWAGGSNSCSSTRERTKFPLGWLSTALGPFASAKTRPDSTSRSFSGGRVSGQGPCTMSGRRLWSGLPRR